jgi:quinol monooxygenase YgiN
MSRVGSTESEYAPQARIEVKPNKVTEVHEFLEAALLMAEEEESTTTWFSYRIDETNFGIFDTFSDEDGRRAHLEGKIADELTANADELLAAEPVIEEMDVIAAKH